ncbi:DEAD/DEAH box helicase [Nitrosomonas ureae]|uniref:Replicative superfamily II helicase n=1 Tax=Nitrosomonas ureae TaxID=44577 RepID=A0A1H9BX63_9PROT|nr:DEAD/DEAH box helicase family protein [Nitrosomonas ureae]SEP93153.1 Replicative superfamily II helicase [Nitrosomonas ureae]
MVDFKKRLKNKTVPKKIDPIEIYNSLDRRSETGPLRPSQEKILEDWFSGKKDEKNNIIKLHTGEGKTLVGLLILQSKINSEEGPCLYVCPNKYLAEQVRLEAQKFGIPHCELSTDNSLPDDFLLGSKILITHVQKAFNGRTIFGLDNKSVKVGAIILDDSHACIDSIKDGITIKVKKEHELYKAILNLFSDDIREQGEGSFLEIESGDYNTMLPVPYWTWYEKKDEVIREILKHKESDKIKFVWPLIKDQIANCQAFISGNVLEISPTLVPIGSFGFFSKATNRVLMSATTQEDSFFIKGLGFDVNSVKLPLTNKDQKWSGEKMILIPSLIHDELDRDAIVNWLAKPNDKRSFGVVLLTPSFNRNKQYQSIGAVIANSDDIFERVKELKNGSYESAVVFVNRYDGIDLPDNACRILIIDSKPFFDSLLDRYEESCRPSSDIINIRIAQKVEQGLGRSVRGEKDYSIIVLVGGDLVKFSKSPLTNKYFSSQTRKQIEIGIQVAEFAKEEADDAKPYDVLINLMKQVLGRDEGWKEYYMEEMDRIEGNIQRNSVHEIFAKEYAAENYFSLAEYDKACAIMQELCDHFQKNDSERGWYLQQLARYKYRISKTEANTIQKTAFQSNLQLLKPLEGISYNKLEYINENRILRIKKWISQYKDYQEMMISLEGILQDLSFGMPAEKFESAMQTIGEALGFLSQRPDKEIKKGPDNLWCGVENQYFLIECKSEVSEERSEITKYEAGQMNSHSAWFESVYGQVNCKRILIIPTKALSYHADFTHHVEIMRKNKLKLLRDNIKSFFKEFSRYVLHEVSEIKIQAFINTHKLDINNMRTLYSEPYRANGKNY